MKTINTNGHTKTCRCSACFSSPKEKGCVDVEEHYDKKTGDLKKVTANGVQVYPQDTDELEINTCLAYCRLQNGRDDCKNCGLTQEMIDNLLASHTEGIVKKVEGLPRYTGGSSVEPKDIRVKLDQVLDTIKNKK